VRGDAEGLRRTAVAVRLQGERLRLLAVHVRAVGDVRWRSPAADLYRAQVDARAHSLQRQAEATDEVARRLDALAESLRGSEGP
jgi:hypothetical protein